MSCYRHPSVFQCISKHFSHSRQLHKGWCRVVVCSSRDHLWEDCGVGGVDWVVGTRGRWRTRWRKLRFTCVERVSSHSVQNHGGKLTR